MRRKKGGKLSMGPLQDMDYPSPLFFSASNYFSVEGHVKIHSDTTTNNPNQTSHFCQQTQQYDMGPG